MVIFDLSHLGIQLFLTSLGKKKQTSSPKVKVLAYLNSSLTTYSVEPLTVKQHRDSPNTGTLTPEQSSHVANQVDIQADRLSQTPGEMDRDGMRFDCMAQNAVKFITDQLDDLSVFKMQRKSFILNTLSQNSPWFYPNESSFRHSANNKKQQNQSPVGQCS